MSALSRGYTLLCIWTLSSHTQEGITRGGMMTVAVPDVTSVHHHTQQKGRWPLEARNNFPRNSCKLKSIFGKGDAITLRPVFLYYWTTGIFGLDSICWGGGGAVQCMATCLAVSLASTSGLPPSCDNPKYLQAVPNIPGEQYHLQLKTTS